MFCDGYRSTYKKAIKRNIPLVSARWMEYSKLANKMLEPEDYPPVDLEKYTKKTPVKNINIPVSKFQYLNLTLILTVHVLIKFCYY